MYSGKLCSLGLVFFTVILGLSLTLSPTNQPQHDRQFVGGPSRLQVADGGAPVPPVPPIKQPKTLVADGGAPVPPVPPIRTSNLMADGGAPVPPVPTPPMTAFVAV